MMDFEAEIEKLKQRAMSQVGVLATEEATKTALVLPIIRALGYDIFNPTEVVPEFIADMGIKKGEKVDYALFRDGTPLILFECKKAGAALDRKQASQLYRYFSVTQVRFGILTDGVRYEFYSDLDDRNKMDNKPFFIFDLMSYTDSDLTELKKFSRAGYDESTILATASNMKYGRLIDAYLDGEFENPSDALVKLVGSSVYEGRMTAQVMEWMTGLLRDALDRAIRRRVRAKLESALQKQQPENTSANAPVPAAVEEGNRDGIVTTPQEAEAFQMIRAILADLVEPDRVFMRDAKSYCAILLDNKNTKPICRLYLDGRQWRVGTFAQKVEVKHDITKLTDLFTLKEALKTSIDPKWV